MYVLVKQLSILRHNDSIQSKTLVLPSLLIEILSTLIRSLPQYPDQSEGRPYYFRGS